MLLLIDNYDSFVHNLARYFNELGCETRVVRNDQVDASAITRLGPQAIVISPGPGTPNEAGSSVDIVKHYSGTVPILGVCLGHQVIGAAFGANIIRARQPVHGRTSLVHHDGTGIFVGLPNPLRATRYHSLIVDEQTLSKELYVVARTTDGTPMAIAHESDVTIGVQFHPESILTDLGHHLLQSFLKLAGIHTPQRVPQSEWQPDLPEESDWPVVPF